LGVAVPGFLDMAKLDKSDYVALADLRRSIRRFLRFAEEGAREEGITPQQHQVLLAIMGQPHRDWASISEVADFLQLRHHTVVGLIDRCESTGLVRRSQSSKDRRRVEVSLTPRGLSILSRLAQRNMKELYSLRENLKYSEDGHTPSRK
jgi:DNA-binding MarR family transcriptional regulator